MALRIMKIYNWSGISIDKRHQAHQCLSEAVSDAMSGGLQAAAFKYWRIQRTQPPPQVLLKPYKTRSALVRLLHAALKIGNLRPPASVQVAHIRPPFLCP